MLNPFRPLPSRPSVQAPPPAAPASTSSSTPVCARGLSGSLRAQAITNMSQDLNMRSARIQHLRIIGEKMREQIQNTHQTGRSRIAWLAKQLDKDF